MNWKKLLVYGIMIIVILAIILFLTWESKNEMVIQEENYEMKCQGYAESECPDDCIVCPPCEACSSLGCNSAEFCNSMGFDKDWYQMVKLQRETIDWQTYTNEEYGFKFDYPNSWDYYFLSDTNTMFAPQEIVNELEEYPGGRGGGKYLTFIVRYYDKDEYEGYIKSNFRMADEFTDMSMNSITIDGIVGEGYELTALTDAPGVSEGDIVIYYAVPHNNGYLEFNLIDNQYIDIFDRIVESVTLF
jgi:hypothetical protein